jgi:hypothetical protein
MPRGNGCRAELGKGGEGRGRRVATSFGRGVVQAMGQGHMGRWRGRTRSVLPAVHYDGMEGPIGAAARRREDGIVLRYDEKQGPPSQRVTSDAFSIPDQASHWLRIPTCRASSWRAHSRRSPSTRPEEGWLWPSLQPRTSQTAAPAMMRVLSIQSRSLGGGFCAPGSVMGNQRWSTGGLPTRALAPLICQGLQRPTYPLLSRAVPMSSFLLARAGDAAA